jgi:hypothetical protein
MKSVSLLRCVMDKKNPAEPCSAWTGEDARPSIMSGGRTQIMV